MRLIGERRAAAATVLAFFALLFFGNALMLPPNLKPMFFALAGVYGMSFFGVVAGWFWARWFTMGVSFSGIGLAILATWQNGMDPLIIFFGGTHGLVAIALAGPGSASFYDGRNDWRTKFRLDENGVNRLGKAIMRAGASLPYLIMATLAPRQGMGLVVAAGALTMGLIGLRALVRLRTWGVLALGASAGMTAGAFEISTPHGGPLPGAVVTGIAIATLILAVIPFARPILRTLRAR